ncbi:uncharacterized protein LOC128932229 isoform X2 [Callithrix jacchus]
MEAGLRALRRTRLTVRASGDGLESAGVSLIPAAPPDLHQVAVCEGSSRSPGLASTSLWTAVAASLSRRGRRRRNAARRAGAAKPPPPQSMAAGPRAPSRRRRRHLVPPLNQPQMENF